MSPEPARILVVEDSAALRENLQEALELEGYRVTAAADGARALDTLANGLLPEVVVVDLMMPGMGGRELVERIRSEPSLAGIRIVVATGHSGPAVRKGIAADAFLLKPFGVKELLDAIAIRPT